MPHGKPGMDRRSFLKQSCLAVAGLTAAGSLTSLAGGGASEGVAIIIRPEDKIAAAEPVRWAAGELQAALKAINVTAGIFPRAQEAPAGNRVIIVDGEPGASAESFTLANATVAGSAVLRAGGGDPRGLVYALLELVDRVRFGKNPIAALDIQRPIAERPANPIRSIARCFVSEVEDKAWFHDREMWGEYLSMLAAQRFNRFSLTFGIGYNTPKNVTDSYFLFAYPFLLAVPGYDVRAKGLPDAERDRNLETLRFISDAAAARGLDFQLGLWSHSFDWPDSPKVNYPITGLTPEKHAAYCRDALAGVLKACPAISGLTLRVHGESGVPAGSYDFWKMLFEAVKGCGRKVEIDMHAKGLMQEMIDIGTATGMPVNISPKYLGEHMGLPYQPMSIRELEMEKGPYVETDKGLGSGNRKYMRYGYGDLFAEDRSYGVLFRIWPGTQRHLLWGDPALAAGFSRGAGFCGARGLELFDPLSFQGRKSSGHAGGRCGYKDKTLEPRYDWQKFEYSYRVWGRHLYNPEFSQPGPHVASRASSSSSAPPEGLRRALAAASRVLPLVTTAHGASANNMLYWPEIYTNMSIVDPNQKHPYNDTAEPKVFTNVSSFDPQLFSSINEFAEGLLKGETPAKYSPLEVAQWLEQLAATAKENLDGMGAYGGAEKFRITADIGIQIGLALFFARKMRAGVFWAIHERTGDPGARAEALKNYRAARDAWAAMAGQAKVVYEDDIAYGPPAFLRGNWSDRLGAIDDDIGAMERIKVGELAAKPVIEPDAIRRALEQLQTPQHRPPAQCVHTAPKKFQPGQPLQIELQPQKAGIKSVRLQYRRVNQAERWAACEMKETGGRFVAAIPAEITQTRFPLQYYFEVHRGEGLALFPGLNPDLANQPYFVVRQV